MKNFKNAIVIIVPYFLFWLFICGAVSVAWRFMTHRIINEFPNYWDGLVNGFVIFHQLPFALVYFIFGFAVAALIDSNKDNKWIIFFCLLGMAVQLLCFRYSRPLGGEIVAFIGKYAPVLLTPWIAVLGFTFWKRIIPEQTVSADGDSS